MRGAVLVGAGLLILALGLPARAADDAELDALAARLRAALPEGLGDDAAGQRALAAVSYGRPLRGRELAEAILAQDPDSYTGHFVLGVALREAEANFPLALYHLQRSLELYEERHGPPTPGAPWFWHHRVLLELATVSQDMARYSDTLAYLEAFEGFYGDGQRQRKGWPLVSLGRWQEARALARSLLAESRDSRVRAGAWETLCVLAGEERDVEGAYRACLSSLEAEAPDDLDPVRFTNAAEAARGALRMQDAERLLLRGTEHFVRGSLGAPWRDLTSLYLSQGRSGEALEAMREMFAWRERQPPYIDTQTWGEQDLTAASLLLVAGRSLEAARLTARALEQPDRTGYNSVDARQMQAAAALLDRVAQRAAAELREEQAAASSWRGAFRARFEALRFRWRAWRSGRRAAALFAEPRLLGPRLQPYPAGFIAVPEWLEPELVTLLGPGVIEAALAEERGRGMLAAGRGYAEVYEAEIAACRARPERTLERAGQALVRLPSWEALLRARVAARAAEAAVAVGQLERALGLFDVAFQLDPGTLRRLGLALPARFEVLGEGVSREAARRLRGSPRFAEATRGFTLRIEGDAERGSACLVGSRGVVLGCAQVTPRAGEDATARGRRLARDFQSALFAPRMDLTQADLRSLDGTPVVAGGASEERLGLVLSDLLGRSSE